MKDFKDTGLPQDPLVYRAYMTYLKNAEPGPAAEHGLRMAEAVQRNFGADAELISLALLTTLPRESLPAVQQLFGQNKADILTEASRHGRTGFAYVAEASPVVQTLASAHAVASLEDFTAYLNTSYRELGIYDASKSERAALPPPPFPNVKLCNQIIKAAYGNTGSDALDWELIDKLQDYEMTADERLIGLPFSAPEMKDYPGFGETPLVQDDKVKAAYYRLTTHSMAETADVDRAIEAARLLSATPGVNATAIAYSLLDLGLPKRNADDLHFLEKDIDWDVMELLAQYSLGRVSAARDLVTAPLECRQSALAGSIATMELQVQRAAENLQRYAESTVPDDLKTLMRQAEESQLRNLAEIAARTIRPVMQSAEAPRLVSLFEEKHGALRHFIDDNFPKAMLALPAPPKPAAKPDSGQNFDL